ncbi:thiol reductant ABC exporter subunit CydD [Stenotrophomonas sp. SY1]|uniref:thiol reductant ABC exporter subunit CydD n=1 Tax=Stenotrophomonas sp. SY1 TaxID=477235 RepID=UPI001E6227F4|nr:thiol reductant ABC exporter subunit CydD [Stenotrophomonas sp. SY1]MCD9086761.1 thiol reductant ABC exporter subunit CydD [Stenotrophomonas sp. SY1]
MGAAAAKVPAGGQRAACLQSGRFPSAELPVLSDVSPSGDVLRQQRRQQQQWLASLAAGARSRQRLAAIAVCSSGALLIVQAGAIAWLIQSIVMERQPLVQTGHVFGLLALVLLLRSLLGGLAQSASGQVADTAKLALREQVYRRLMARGPLWLRRQRSGELGELLVAHGDAIEGYYAGFQPVRVEVVVVPVLIALAVAWVDWVVALIFIFTAPLVPFFMMLVGWGAEAASRQQLGELARMSGHFADRIKGLGLLRLYGRGQAELEGISQAAEGVRVRTMKVLRIAFLSSTVLEFFASVSVAMVALYLGLSYLGMMSLHATVPTLGTGMFCLLLAPEFYAPLRRLAAHYHDRANALAAAAEVERLLADVPEDEAPMPVPVDAEPAQRHAPMVALRSATLRPQGANHDVLVGFSLDIADGQRLALVGPSGSGKSTLLEALAGWLPPREGRIVLRDGLRVGYAGQRPYLFHGSIADNLRLADPAVSDTRLQAVAEVAQVMRFARHLPQGLDTVIGERGFGLSGGEARRIGLARLLLLEPDLFLLDEPTAFLDPQTEADLLQALASHTRGRTVLMATHSEVAMRWADQIIRLPGSVSEELEVLP